MATMTDQRAQRLIDSSLFDPHSAPPADQCIFFNQWKRILNLGDYALFTGKKGSAKTKMIAAAIAAAITRQPVFNFSIKLPDLKRQIIHFDTEQGRGSHFRLMELIKQMIGADLPGNFRSHRCRGFPPNAIQRMIEYYLKAFDGIGMFVLDGMLDIVDNMNDTTESKRLKEWMEKITETYNIAIIGVMHRGFSADKALGHAGSYLERGAQTVLKVEKDQDQGITFYRISTEHIREDSPPPDTAFYFNKSLSEWQIYEIGSDPAAAAQLGPQPRKMWKNSPLQYDIQEHTRRTGQIFDSIGTLISYDQLIREISIAYGCSQSQAKGEFYQYLLGQFFYKMENGYTNKRQARLYVEK